MAHFLIQHLHQFFGAFGYWAVCIALLGENAGLPLPGETILLYASFLAYSEHRLHLSWIILAGICACTLGDNLGYLIGHRGGRRLLHRHQRWFRISPQTLARGERLFQQHGAVAIFFARFIFGLRIIAGPLAGVLLMPWRRFLLFNFLGAAAWVSAVAGVGYIFGREFEAVLRIVGRLNWIVLALVIAAAVAAYFRFRNAE
ncbi:MAG TPA: DedA family protein [Terriglobales bacterium]|nr:DedA family protein [Terriglobales bacterium]